VQQALGKGAAGARQGCSRRSARVQQALGKGAEGAR